MPALTTRKAGALRLGRELARGGEGIVFELADHPDFVSKIYHFPPDQQKSAKLLAMAEAGTERLRRISAWPIDTIHNEHDGLVRGFVMRKVARQQDIHQLYGPKTRLRHYPEATYTFLVHVAANLARAFAVVHEHGHVIGDVNQGGVCVSREGTVTLVDCDSFQVRGAQAFFNCDVGIPIYQPPELQSVASFRGLRRTSNHDAFGLAVLVFQTLFLARHPFAGAFQGHGDMPIEQAIREFRFAYARDASRRHMRQPPGTLGLGAVPPDIAQLFERAFLEEGAQHARPSPIEWVAALDSFRDNLRSCNRNPSHTYYCSLGTCPLCDIESRVGSLLFLRPRQHSTQAPPINIEDVWRDIAPVLASTKPPDNASIQALLPPPSEAVLAFKLARDRAATLLLIGSVILCLSALFWGPASLVGILPVALLARLVRGEVPAEARDLKRRLSAAERHFSTIVRHVEQERNATPVPNLEARAIQLYGLLTDFTQHRAERLQTFERHRHASQFQRYLDSFEIKDCSIRGIGPGLAATLLSNGIETAADVTESALTGIPGFGPVRIAALIEWRARVERQFRYNPTDPGDSRERIRIESELHNEYARNASEFQHVASALKAAAGPLSRRIADCTTDLDRVQRDLASLRAIALTLGRAA